MKKYELDFVMRAVENRVPGAIDVASKEVARLAIKSSAAVAAQTQSKRRSKSVQRSRQQNQRIA